MDLKVLNFQLFSTNAGVLYLKSKLKLKVMKSKKSEKANLEKQKGILFTFGLVISLGAVLVAFEWKTKPNAIIVPNISSNDVIEETYTPPATIEKKEIPKPKIEVEIIEIIGNNEIVLEPIEFSTSEIENPILDFEAYLNILPEEKIEKEKNVFIIAEQMPEFPGGELALLKYLANSIQYPVIAMENGITGKIYVSFIINEKGGIEDVNLLRGIDEALNNEALRVVKSLPKWQPGRQGGKAVKVRYTLPIVFEMR